VNERRNIPLAMLAALRHPGVEFFSLRKGQPAVREDLAMYVREAGRESS
jgi:hypothetical protein